MEYNFDAILRMYGRDLVFATKYYREKLLALLSQRPNKTLVLCNSYHKSGTHLLYQILYAAPGLHKWDDIVAVQALCGLMNSVNHIRWKLGSASNASIIRSHLMYCDEVLSILSEFDVRLLFIYRDLRDVALSHARWVTQEERIFLHDVYVQKETFDEQLMSSIMGVPLGTPFASNASHPDIGTDFSRWQGWVTNSQTLAVKFEDLVGERGGGDEAKRLHLVEHIMDHLEISISTSEIKSRFASQVMNPEESHTFQKGGKGTIGGWQKFFKESHKQAFKRVAGDILIDLGYETDLCW